MEVNDLLIDNLAKLSHLSFSDEEKKEIRADLQEMISFIEKLKELNTEGVAPLLHMSSNVNILRDDEVQGSVSREEALKNAPQTDGTFFKVPKVIRK
ncbi:MAG TPA: Asp-tRNA(Asn)/Glu-tRNA(Gln) amidotransferase subunit GatC [Flavitalea sp.]|nr:Asp-tRNA(Asn)/Glu-tRNA(Gln) amidotransferase subunit GatC [Flavitalea sp.]